MSAFMSICSRFYCSLYAYTSETYEILRFYCYWCYWCHINTSRCLCVCPCTYLIYVCMWLLWRALSADFVFVFSIYATIGGTLSGACVVWHDAKNVKVYRPTFRCNLSTSAHVVKRLLTHFFPPPLQFEISTFKYTCSRHHMYIFLYYTCIYLYIYICM